MDSKTIIRPKTQGQTALHLLSDKSDIQRMIPEHEARHFLQQLETAKPEQISMRTQWGVLYAHNPLMPTTVWYFSQAFGPTTR
jgi:hypothetical protein